MREKDITEKALENYDDVFADIVNALVFDGEKIVKGTELEQVLPKEAYNNSEGEIHEQERDVVKAWRNGTIRIALLGMENQTDVDYDMPLRTISYDGASYGNQVNNKAQKRRYPVITLVLFFGDGPWTGPRSLKERLTIPERAERFVNDYKLHIIEMGQLSREEIERFQSDFRVIAEYFWHEAKGEDYFGDDDVLEHPQEVANLLFALTKDDRFNVNVEKERKERSRDMMRSKMLDRAEARGEARGEKRGEERGRSDALQIVRLFVNGNDIAQVAEVIGEKEEVVRKNLVEAGLIEE